MKKFAICFVALAVVALLVPSAQAAGRHCYVLTNFCDGIQTQQIHVGGITGQEVVGLWDYVCIKNNDGALFTGAPNKFGTQPTYPFHSGGVPAGFAANFTFKPSTHTFDLYYTLDGMTTGAFQTNQAYTLVNGNCNPLARTGRSATGQ